MGRLTVPGVLGVDANCFIYLFEPPGSERGRRVQEMFVEPTTSAVVTSVLTIAELLIKPLRDGSEQEANDLREAVVAIPRLEIIDVNLRVAETAALIRAATNLKLPDAIHLATAVQQDAAAFLTNDSRFKRGNAFLPILILDELIAAELNEG